MVLCCGPRHHFEELKAAQRDEDEDDTVSYGKKRRMEEEYPSINEGEGSQRTKTRGSVRCPPQLKANG